METIYNWTARRAGAGVTVYGKSAEGEFRRVTGVVQITLEVREGAPAVIAASRDNVLYRLALAHL